MSYFSVIGALEGQICSHYAQLGRLRGGFPERNRASLIYSTQKSWNGMVYSLFFKVGMEWNWNGIGIFEYSMEYSRKKME